MKKARLGREIDMLTKDPPPGVSGWPVDDRMDELEGVLEGPEDTPYHGGRFKLKMSIPDRYPFEPPCVKFVTKIYHPNIDSIGNICLDSLKLPPSGAWKPCLNLSQILSQIRLLLMTPNPDDGLMPEITAQYRNDPKLFRTTAKQHTARYAMTDTQGKDKVQALATSDEIAPNQSNIQVALSTSPAKQSTDEKNRIKMASEDSILPPNKKKLKTSETNK